MYPNCLCCCCVQLQVDGAPVAAAGSAVGGLQGSAEARGHIFSALAQLTQRLPDLFQVGDDGACE
jgi:hypothetical protein